MRYLITTILLALAPLSWGVPPDNFWEDNFNFPYLCVTSGTYQTPFTEAGSVYLNKNDTFIVKESGHSRIGKEEKDSLSCQKRGISTIREGYVPGIVCEGSTRLAIKHELGTKRPTNFIETEWVMGEEKGKPEMFVTLRTGKCSPINQ